MGRLASRVIAPSSSTAAMEEALGSDLRLALVEEARVLGVPLSRFPDWSHVPHLRRWETVATLRLAEALRPECRSGEEAFDRACARLGTDPDAVRSAFKRAGRYARGRWPRST